MRLGYKVPTPIQRKALGPALEGVMHRPGRIARGGARRAVGWVVMRTS